MTNHKNHINHSLFCMICIVLLPFTITIGTFGQKKDKKPDWLVHGTPKPSAGSFTYKVAEGYAASPDAAQKQSLQNLGAMVAAERKISGNVEVVTEANQQTDARGMRETVNTRFVIKTTVEEDPISITFEKKDEYMVFENGNYRCYALYAVATENVRQVSFDHLNFTTRYGVRGVARSMVVPGWGQIYKGSPAKGISILGGEVILTGGIIACESLKQSYLKKIKETRNINQIRTYADKADTYENIRNVCIGAAAALYVYNLIDAATASGRKRTIVNKPVVFTPVTTSQYVGAGVTLTF